MVHSDRIIRRWCSSPREPSLSTTAPTRIFSIKDSAKVFFDFKKSLKNFQIFLSKWHNFPLSHMGKAWVSAFIEVLFWPKNERKKWQFFPFLEENLTRLIHLIGRERRIVVLVRKGPGAGDTPRLSLSLFSVSRLFTTLARFFYPFPISIRENRAKKALKQRNTQKLQSGVNKFHYFAKGTFSSSKLSDRFPPK